MASKRNLQRTAIDVPHCGVLLQSLLVAAFALANACAPSPDTPAVDGGTFTKDGGVEPVHNGGRGRFASDGTCEVIAPPSRLNLNSRYTQYLNCSGIPVVGSDKVTEEAILTTDQILAFMLVDADAIKSKLIENGAYYVLAGEGEIVEGIPEFAGVSGVSREGYTYSDDRGGLQVSASLMSNVLCAGEYIFRGDNAVVHEFSHLIHFAALAYLEPSFETDLQKAYAATGNAVWANTYAGSSYYEFWAEGVSAWFGVNGDGPAGGDGTNSDVNTRAELKDADPTLYALIAKHFHKGQDVPGCVRPNVVVPNRSCDATVDDIDGNTYNVVAIGDQCWMQENLKTTRFQNGDEITHASDAGVWEDGTVPVRTFYLDDSQYESTYGALYNWQAVTSDAGLCPDGWHAPSITDWLQLVYQLGGYEHAGGKMKSTDAMLWMDPNTEATNSSGLSVLPGGSYLYDGQMQFLDEGAFTNFWSTSEFSDTEAYMLQLFFDGGQIWMSQLAKKSGLYVRCVQD